MKSTPGRLRGFVSNVNPVSFFVVTAAVFGLIFIVITPPFQAPDEPVHFYRSYQISEGNFVVDRVGSTYGGVLPKSLGETIWRTANNPIIQGYAQLKYKGENTTDVFSIKEDKNIKAAYDITATAITTPVAYAPQATGILTARLFRAPPILMMYMGRLFNLVAWILLLGFAIWLIIKHGCRINRYGCFILGVHIISC